MNDIIALLNTLAASNPLNVSVSLAYAQVVHEVEQAFVINCSILHPLDELDRRSIEPKWILGRGSFFF